MEFCSCSNSTWGWYYYSISHVEYPCSSKVLHKSENAEAVGIAMSICRCKLLNDHALTLLLWLLYFVSSKECEDYLSQLVTKKTIFARIDRPEGVVSFRQSKDPSEILNEWSRNLSSLMSLVSKTTHLINKEEMVHALVKWSLVLFILSFMLVYITYISF